MSALWGFLGTIVGAAAVFSATVWQQRVSHKHEREMRRRDSQIEILTALSDAMTNLLTNEDRANENRRREGDKIQRVEPTSEVVGARFEVTRLTTLVLDKGVLRSNSADLMGALRAVNEAEKLDVLEQRHQEVTQIAGQLLSRIGEQLRALY